MRCRFALVLVGVAACGDDAVHKLPDAPAPPDVAVDIAVDIAIDAPACAAVTGAGTTHGASIAAPETWTAAGSPHLVPNDMSITAALTIEHCAVVRISAGRQISVRANGSITTLGQPGLPVRIEKADAAAWVNIRALNGGTISLTHTQIDGGGDPLTGVAQTSGALDIAGTTPVVAPILHADNVTITGSKSCGISLHDGGGFDATSASVVISGSMVAPITTFARLAGTIPTGTYTGNTADGIIVSNGAIPDTMTLHARGVPYLVGTQANATLDVGAITGLATLTIEPGVTMKFFGTATFRVEPASGTNPARGALIANGTAAAPIVLTSASATPAAGDWYGLWLGGLVDATTRLDHVRVEFAGRSSASGSDSCIPTGQLVPNDAAIRILGAAPAVVFITNSEIVSSAFHGIDRGFRSDTKPSYIPTNTFTGIAQCKESYPRDVAGTCPGTIPCP